MAFFLSCTGDLTDRGANTYKTYAYEESLNDAKFVHKIAKILKGNTCHENKDR